jgi:hypothetical protein
MNDGSGDYIYLSYINDRYINTAHLLRFVAPLVWNFQFRGEFLMILFSEVIVFFFLLSYLSKNLRPLQKQHPRSVGNRPFKRKSMPYSIILDSMRSLRYKTTWPFWVAYFSFPSHRPWKRIPLFCSLQRKLVVIPSPSKLSLSLQPDPS